jgi:Transcriptional regulatory protein, C terminal
MRPAAYRPLTAGRHGVEAGWSSGFSGPSMCWMEISPDLPGQRQRSLLALLLLHANQVVSSSRLIEELCPNEASESLAGALQASVSRLRKSLGAGAELLVTLPTGYMIRVPGAARSRMLRAPRPDAGDAEPPEAA